MEVWQKPCNSDEIVARIVALMQHYYAPTTYQSIGEQQFIDWGEILRELPATAFDAACKEWVRTKTRRPTPADILKLGKELGGAEMDEYWDMRAAWNEPEHAPDELIPTFDKSGQRIIEADAA